MLRSKDLMFRTVRPEFGTQAYDPSGNYLAGMRMPQRRDSRNPLLGGGGGGGMNLLAQAIAQEEARRQWLSDMINNPATQQGLRGLLSDLFDEKPDPNRGSQFTRAGSEAIDRYRQASPPPPSKSIILAAP